MKLNVFFEDDDILVVEKSVGLVVNRADTTHDTTLQDLLSEHFKLPADDLGIGERAGIVHRLDKETSGLLVVAKKQRVFEFLQRQFKDRLVKKKYIALVHGWLIDNSGQISSNIGRIGKFGKFGTVSDGRESLTKFEVSAKYTFAEKKLEDITGEINLSKNRINYLKNHATAYTLLKIKPFSGRTHQVRVHLKSIGHPIVSDSLYAPGKLLKFDLAWCPRLFLHSSYLEFKTSKTKPRLKFNLELPSDLKKSLAFLDN